MPRIMIIAGETSGDLHGSGVVREILRRRPDAEIVGIGGPQMSAAGMTCFYSTDQMAILGFTEVVRHFPFIRQVHARLTRELQTAPADLLILIDYPGFNLRFAKQAKKQGIPILYYISPQVWAWGRGRVKKIARLVDKMAVIFKFEEEIYREAGVDVTFVGHPLLDSLRFDWDRESFLKSLNYPPETKIFGLLPGSRPQEVQKLLPKMIETFFKLKEVFPDLQGVVSRSPQLSPDFYDPFLSDELVLTPQTHALMQNSHFMIVASGTATLEAALYGSPFVVAYKISELSYLLGKFLISVDHIGLVNIVAGKRIVPEFIQRDFRSSVMVPVIERILTDAQEYYRIQTDLSKIREKLGTPGASARVAELAIEMAGQR